MWLHAQGKKLSLRGSSIFQNGFLNTLSLLGRCLAWHVGNGQDILIGTDPIIGSASHSFLPYDLRDYLLYYGIATLHQAQNTLMGTHGYWFLGEDLDIGGVWKDAWEVYTKGLEQARICLNSAADSLLWVIIRKTGMSRPPWYMI